MSCHYGDNYYCPDADNYTINYYDQNNLKKVEEELNKYLFCYHKYISHYNEIENIKRKLNEILNNYDTLMIDKNIYQDSLIEGYKTVLFGLRVLMNTYIIRYYLKNDSKNKTLFDYNQSQLKFFLDNFIDKLEEKNSFENSEETSCDSAVIRHQDVIKKDLKILNKYINNILIEIEEVMIFDVIKQ